MKDIYKTIILFVALVMMLLLFYATPHTGNAVNVRQSSQTVPVFIPNYTIMENVEYYIVDNNTVSSTVNDGMDR